MKKIAMSLIMLTLFRLISYAQSFSPIGVVNENGLRLRSSPNLDSSIVTLLNKNTLLNLTSENRIGQTINGQNGNWINVKTVNGLSGWVFDQWIDIYTDGAHYIDVNDFYTNESTSYTSENNYAFGNVILETAKFFDHNEEGKLIINKYLDNKYIYSYLLQIDNYNYWAHIENYPNENRLNIEFISEDDFIVSCLNRNNSIVLLRIQNNSLLWKKEFSVGSMIYATTMKFDGEQFLYLAASHNNNFDISNYDVNLLKLDLNGHLVKAKSISTPKWDSVEKVLYMDDHVYLIGAFNGTHNWRLLRLDQELNINRQADFRFSSNMYRINSIIQSGSQILLSGTPGVVRNNPNMSTTIVAVSKDLEIIWSHRLSANSYNTDFGLIETNSGIMILGHSSDEYSYDLDRNQEVFWFVEYDINGDRLDEKHVILPVSVEITGFAETSEYLRVFGYFPYFSTSAYGSTTITKIGFNFMLQQESVSNTSLQILEEPDYPTITFTDYRDYIDADLQMHQLDAEVTISTTKLSFLEGYPWTNEVLDAAAFFDLSER